MRKSHKSSHESRIPGGRLGGASPSNATLGGGVTRELALAVSSLLIGCGSRESKSAVSLSKPFRGNNAVVVCRKKPHAWVDTPVLVANLTDLLEFLVIGVRGELCRSNVAALAFDVPNYAVSTEVEDCPV